MSFFSFCELKFEHNTTTRFVFSVREGCVKTDFYQQRLANLKKEDSTFCTPWTNQKMNENPTARKKHDLGKIKVYRQIQHLVPSATNHLKSMYYLNLTKPVLGWKRWDKRCDVILRWYRYGVTWRHSLYKVIAIKIAILFIYFFH